MWDKHRLEAENHAVTGPLVVAFYWLCWLLIAGVLIVLLVGR